MAPVGVGRPKRYGTSEGDCSRADCLTDRHIGQSELLGFTSSDASFGLVASSIPPCLAWLLCRHGLTTRLSDKNQLEFVAQGLLRVHLRCRLA